MYARLPREMVAAISRGLCVPVGANVAVEALNYASAQLAGYYSWPWFMSEVTKTFRAPLSGVGTMQSSGVFAVTSISDGSYETFVDKNWRLMVAQHDYPVASVADPEIATDTSKVSVIPATDANFRLFQSCLTMPEDFRPGSDFAIYNTTLRYRVRHINRMAFQRHWQSYKQMSTNNTLVCSDVEPYLDTTATPDRWVYRLEFCPPPASGTQIRIVYQRAPATIDVVTNAPTEWPRGYDEALELLAIGRLGELLSDSRAMLAGKRAQGLIRQLRGTVATAVMDETPIQNSAFSGASWEHEGLSVLPRES